MCRKIFFLLFIIQYSYSQNLPIIINEYKSSFCSDINSVIQSESAVTSKFNLINGKQKIELSKALDFDQVDYFNGKTILDFSLKIVDKNDLEPAYVETFLTDFNISETNKNVFSTLIEHVSTKFDINSEDINLRLNINNEYNAIIAIDNHEKIIIEMPDEIKPPHDIDLEIKATPKNLKDLKEKLIKYLDTYENRYTCTVDAGDSSVTIAKVKNVIGKGKWTRITIQFFFIYEATGNIGLQLIISGKCSESMDLDEVTLSKANDISILGYQSIDAFALKIQKEFINFIRK